MSENPGKIRKIQILRIFRILFFSLFFGKIGPKPPGESKTQAKDSFCIDKSSIRANLTDFVFFFRFFFESSKKSGPIMKLFSTFLQRPSPQTPWDPVSGQELIMLVSCDKFSSRLDQMAPHSCPFFVSNFDTFSTAPPKHVWALWDSPAG